MNVSVIIASWNAKDLLRDCLKSVKDQGSRYLQQIIVVDNGSHDGSPEMVERELPDVRLVRWTDNRGYAAAVNEGIRISTGTYVCILNSDIILRPGCLDSMVEHMEKHPEIGILGPRLLTPEGQLNSTCRKFPTLWNNFCSLLGLHRVFKRSSFFSSVEMEYFDHQDTQHVEVLAGSFWLVRRQAIDQVGLLDEGYFMYAEDMDWCFRFSQSSWPVVFFPQATAYHHHGGSSARMPVRFHIQQYRAGLRYWRKYHSRAAVFVVRSLMIARHMRRCLAALARIAFRRGMIADQRTNLEASWKCCLWLAGMLHTEDDEKIRPTGTPPV